MRRTVLNSLLLLFFLVTVALNWLKPDLARPNWEYFPNMAHSPRYNAFAANPDFADGKTLQPPPPGAIPRGMSPLHYAATPQDALRAGEELQDPNNIRDPRVLARGAWVFTNFCAECHGAGGLGDGLIAQRGFPPPPSLLAERALKMKDGQMFHLLTYGQNNMPSYAGQVSREDRWTVIAYVRSLQTAAAAKPPAAAAAATPSAATPKGGQP